MGKWLFFCCLDTNKNNRDVCTKCIKLNLKCLRTNQKPPLLPGLFPRRLTNVSKTKPKI